jgi:ribosomal protein S5
LASGIPRKHNLKDLQIEMQFQLQVCSNIAKLVFMGKRECFKLLTIGSINGTIGIDRSHTRQASRAVTS